MRFMALVAAFIATLGGAVFSGAKVISAIEAQSTTVTHSMKVGDLTRSWQVIRPTATLPKSAPIFVVLSGIAATIPQEETRDRLIPYVDAGKAELVYPVPVRESWNADGCCGAAARLNINDTAFLEALVPRIDPGREHPVYFIGYSNGGRLAYHLECVDPRLFDGMAAVKADPLPNCVVSKPQNILVFSALNDPWVPFKPGEKGKEIPPATVEISRLHAALKCPYNSVVSKHGVMTFTTWSTCADGKHLGWAVYKIGGHNFPPPTAHTPGADQIIWSFFTRTPLAPLPT